MLTVAIPILAVVVFSVVVLNSFVGSQPGQDFTVGVSILFWQLNSTKTGSYARAIVPPAIGVPGGVWASHQWDGDGLNNHYPVYMDQPTAGNYSGVSFIHVRSRSTRVYTLWDFFNVWGQPIGQNLTLVYPVPPTDSNNFGSTWFWDMCVKPPGGVLGPPPKDWGSLPLVQGGQTILLYYGPYGCA